MSDEPLEPQDEPVPPGYPPLPGQPPPSGPINAGTIDPPSVLASLVDLAERIHALREAMRDGGNQNALVSLAEADDAIAQAKWALQKNWEYPLQLS